MVQRTVRFPALTLIFFVIVAVFGNAPMAASDEVIQPSPRVSLVREKDSNGVPGHTLTACIQAKQKAIFDIIADTGGLHDLFPEVRTKFLSKENTGKAYITKTVYEERIKSPIGIYIMHVQTISNYQAYTTEWKRISGDGKAFEGSSKVELIKGHPGWVKLTYSLFTDVGGITPQFITDRVNKADLLGLVPNVEKRLHGKMRTGTD